MIRLFALVLALCASAVQASAITLEPQRVSEHVYYFQGAAGMASQANQGFMSNAGFVVTPDGVVVYDALATPVLGTAMLTAIRKITAAPIKLIVVGHYHADHFYGLQALRRSGAHIVAHAAGQEYLKSDEARERLAQRRRDLAPYIDADTQLVAADEWLQFPGGAPWRYTLGGLHFRVIDSSGAHSPSDVMLYFEEDHVLFAGDLFFTGRLPFVGNADSRHWLAALERMLDTEPQVVIPGHGPASRQPREDMLLTQRYLRYLREKMGAAVQDLTPFDEAYARTDWSAFSGYPAFEQANRTNAYGTYLLMEQESLNQSKEKK